MVAAVRELREETGIQSARIVAAKDAWLTYDCPTCTRSQFTGGWVRYKGQTQKWYAMPHIIRTHPLHRANQQLTMLPGGRSVC